jgi:hypothetical protein
MGVHYERPFGSDRHKLGLVIATASHPAHSAVILVTLAGSFARLRGARR